MNRIKSCGVVVFKEDPELSFLLMRHKSRWDFPKGHVDDGESEIECALRELEEETGISEDIIKLDEHFRHANEYQVKQKKRNQELRDKTLVLFLGFIEENVEIVLTEHIGYEWIKWNPPHEIQERAIDPALQAIAEYWNEQK